MKRKLLHIEDQLPVLDLGHVHDIIDHSQQMPAGKRDLFQTMLYLLGIINIGNGDGRHPHNPVHRSPDVMAHIGKKFTLCLACPLRRLPRLIQRMHLLAHQPEISRKYKEKGQHDQRAVRQRRECPLISEVVDGLVHQVVGHADQQIPFGIGQAGAVHMPPLPIQCEFNVVFLIDLHSNLQFLDKGLLFHAQHAVIAFSDPVKVIAAVQPVAPENKVAVF